MAKVNRKKLETELARSNERLRLAAHVGKMFAYEWDADTDVFQVLGEIPKTFGIEKEEYATGKLMLAKMHPDDRQRLMAEIAGISPEKPEFRIRIRLMRSDGTLIWVEKNGYWVFNEHGRLLRIVGMVIDITESKQAEEALSAANHKLIRAHEEERTRIARELHDDIVQRLALLAISLERLEQSPPAFAVEIRRQIHEQSKHASEIASDVQAMSHRLHSSKVQHLGIVVAAKGFCREISANQNVEIDFTDEKIPSAVPEEIALCLFRVLQETLQNAVKHSGVRHFEVKLQGSPNEIHLTLRDAGVGFDPEVAMKKQGLGLTSIQERVSLVKGTLSITSKPQFGTEVQVRIPLSPGSRTDQAKAAGNDF